MTLADLIDKLESIRDEHNGLMDVVIYVPGDDPGLWDLDGAEQYKIRTHKENGADVKHLEIHIYG